MTFDIQTLFPDLEALTPDGRWNMLQDWLKDNPEYGERIEDWSKQSSDQVLTELCEMIAAKRKIPVIMIRGFIGGIVEQQIKRAIETLQACYRERAGEYKAEHTSGWMAPDNDPRPMAHKTIGDRQQQLKAKKKRRRKTNG